MEMTTRDTKLRPTPYQARERAAQARWKDDLAPAAELSPAARARGTWRGIARGYFLPAACAHENLWSEVREELLAFFARHDIAWHDEDAKEYGPRERPGPSPHLLDSQVSALNFWWGLALVPRVLARVLRAAVPDLVSLEVSDVGGHLLEPEWTGRPGTNYLGEFGRKRRRGKYATSGDLFFVYRDNGGVRRGILLESKYTEDYARAELRLASGFGTDRVAIYTPAFDAPWSPFKKDSGLSVADLLVEPFDQHLRQQLLAAAAEQDREMGLASVTCLHVAPRANVTLASGISGPALRGRGATVGEAWRSLLVRPERFREATYEDLFQLAVAAGEPALQGWCRYQRERYRWGEPLPG
jgi:hypothetical protein